MPGLHQSQIYGAPYYSQIVGLPQPPAQPQTPWWVWFIGGAIAVGHPLGGSGAILMTRLVHHMRDNGIRYGLQSMCEAGGMANTTILELL